MALESVSKPAPGKVTEGKVNKFFDGHVFGLNQYSECLVFHTLFFWFRSCYLFVDLMQFKEAALEWAALFM